MQSPTFHESWDLLKDQHELEEAWIAVVTNSCHWPLLPACLQVIGTPRKATVEKQSRIIDM